jgi:hypothetical protein
MELITSGIGHDIIGILDGDESNPYIMNDYYQTELDDYTRGRVYFPYRNLALDYTLLLSRLGMYITIL